VKVAGTTTSVYDRYAPQPFVGDTLRALSAAVPAG
jgi:hypothetical protein